MTYAARTSVTVERSKQEIERMLTRYGASKFFTGWDQEAAVVGFNLRDRYVQFKLPLPQLNESTRRGGKTAALAAHEQAHRAAWRGLVLCIKAKLESVEAGIESFEQAFLPHIMVNVGGRAMTIGDVIIPQIDEVYAGGGEIRLALPSGE